MAPRRRKRRIRVGAIGENALVKMVKNILTLTHIYSEDLSRELAAHPVTWSRRDSFCEDQYADAQPVELPTAPVATVIAQLEPPKGKPGFEKFDFEGRLQ